MEEGGKHTGVPEHLLNSVLLHEIKDTPDNLSAGYTGDERDENDESDEKLFFPTVRCSHINPCIELGSLCSQPLAKRKYCDENHSNSLLSVGIW